MVIRTYFDRNNTIFKNSEKNLGKNPVAELVYGGNNKFFSRMLFQIDETRLKNLYQDKTISDLSKVKHTLKMVNTGYFDESLLGTTTCYGKKRASSFDMILFNINQEWDEGVGYDLEDNFTLGEGVLSTEPSNWFYAKNNSEWASNGVFSGNSNDIIGTQHFEQGNENLEIDITDVVNGYITGETNNGIGLAFEETFEQNKTTEINHVGFFTRHTQTFYEPYIETIYDNPIIDDRHNFYINKTNKLYLYSNINGNPQNLDNVPTVNIYDNEDVLFSSFTGNQVTQITKGVYMVELIVPESEEYSENCGFKDVWSNINYNNNTLSDIELSFYLKNSNKYFNIGDNNELPKNTTINISGIRHNEKINRGDLRKVIVTAAIPYTINQKQSLEGLKYRLYVKEGPNQLTIINNQSVNTTNDYDYFLLDTQSLLPNTYYLDVTTKSNLEVKQNINVISFEIVSEVNEK